MRNNDDIALKVRADFRDLPPVDGYQDIEPTGASTIIIRITPKRLQ